MNQVFRITVGQETILGRLPAVRVGRGYCCRFHIYGVEYSEETPPPKIWITTADNTLFWTGTWDSQIGAWVVEIGGDAAATVGSAYNYALTVFGADLNKQYIVGQGLFAVYDSIASGGETGGTSGTSLSDQIVDLQTRLTVVEEKLAAFVSLSSFDPETSNEEALREQVRTITDILREVNGA